MVCNCLAAMKPVALGGAAVALESENTVIKAAMRETVFFHFVSPVSPERRGSDAVLLLTMLKLALRCTKSRGCPIGVGFCDAALGDGLRGLRQDTREFGMSFGDAWPGGYGSLTEPQRLARMAGTEKRRSQVAAPCVFESESMKNKFHSPCRFCFPRVPEGRPVMQKVS